jgi:Uma2 family endonuclease
LLALASELIRGSAALDMLLDRGLVARHPHQLRRFECAHFEVCRQFGNWAERDGSGIAFGSAIGFILPNGAMRSPDAAWVRHECWEALSRDQREQFPPLCPDFAVELGSPSDRLRRCNAA